MIHSLRFAALSALALGATAQNYLPPVITSNFYVSDFSNDRVAVYDSAGTFLRHFSGPGLNGPRGIVIGPGLEIFVASELSHEILVFGPDEVYRRRFTDAALSGPTGMAFSSIGFLYVSSFNNARICVFSTAGTFSHWFSATGLSTPNCVALAGDGFIYVASAGTGRIFQFNPGETFLGSFTTPAGTPLSSPMGIARDASDVLYVSGGGSNNIVKFALNGSFLGTITHPSLTGPQGVAIDDRGHIFSSSYYQNVIVEFDASGAWVQTISGGSLNTPRSIAFVPHEQSPFATYCYGDGSGMWCPCGNAGAPGTGCFNSTGQSAALAADGTASVAADSLTLRAIGMPANAPGLYFQGTQVLGGGLGSLFGDGLRCVGGTVIRLGTESSSPQGASSHPGAGDLPVAVRGLVPPAGGTRHYQVWYRNAAAFCTPAAFNLTNGVTIPWGP